MTTRSRYTAAIIDKPWWLAGGIPRSACVAAYCASLASNYEASKINLANPGVYDAVNSIAFPTWDVENGWYFGVSSSSALKTGWQPTPGKYYTGICRFSGDTDDELNYLFGGLLTGTLLGFTAISRRPSTDQHNVRINGTNALASPRLTAGVLCNASGMCYLDGVYESGTPVLLEQTIPRIYIGADNLAAVDGDKADSSMNGYIQAVAFYDTLLTGPQIAALTIAMNAL